MSGPQLLIPTSEKSFAKRQRLNRLFPSHTPWLSWSSDIAKIRRRLIESNGTKVFVPDLVGDISTLLAQVPSSSSYSLRILLFLRFSRSVQKSSRPWKTAHNSPYRRSFPTSPEHIVEMKFSSFITTRKFFSLPPVLTAFTKTCQRHPFHSWTNIYIYIYIHFSYYFPTIIIPLWIHFFLLSFLAWTFDATDLVCAAHMLIEICQCRKRTEKIFSLSSSRKAKSEYEVNVIRCRACSLPILVRLEILHYHFGLEPDSWESPRAPEFPMVDNSFSSYPSLFFFRSLFLFSLSLSLYCFRAFPEVSSLTFSYIICEVLLVLWNNRLVGGTRRRAP